MALSAILPIKSGDLFTAVTVRGAIQKLYSTGEYADIAVDASLSNNELILRFVTTPAYFIGHVSVEGVPEPPSRGQLR